MDELFDKLAAPFEPEAISWRVGNSNKKKIQRETGNNQAKATKGMALAYLDARDVMDRFDTVCGPAGWQCRYSHANGKTVCDIGVRVQREGESQAEWVWKADGAGDSDIEAEKGALSDAFKRAAVRWGVGRYLYGVSSPWVDLDEWEQIPKGELAKLRNLLAAYTGVSRKSSAQAKRDKDYEFFIGKIAEAPDLEILGAIGREIKQALPGLPVAFHEPLQDAYAAKREELRDVSRAAA